MKLNTGFQIFSFDDTCRSAYHVKFTKYVTNTKAKNMCVVSCQNILGSVGRFFIYLFIYFLFIYFFFSFFFNS